MFSVGSFLQRKPAPLIGLDISTSGLKLVELGRNRAGVWVLERCALEPLDNGCVADGVVQNTDAVTQALRRLLQKSGTATKRVALGLPHSAVITKKMLLPSGLSETDMELQVQTEASQYIPFSLDEVHLDFCELGPSARSPGDVDVFLAACRREKVQELQALTEAAGLELAVVDIEPYAVRRAATRCIDRLPLSHASPVVAVFEVGAVSTQMQVLRDGELLFESQQAFGGALLTQSIVQQYGFSYDEAETKKRSGDLPQDYATAVLRPFLHTAAMEMERLLQSFFSSTPHHRVDHILVAGGSATVSRLAKAVGMQTGFVATTLNPFDSMEMASAVNPKKAQRTAPSYLAACGLAMRRFAS